MHLMLKIVSSFVSWILRDLLRWKADKKPPEFIQMVAAFSNEMEVTGRQETIKTYPLPTRKITWFH